MYSLFNSLIYGNAVPFTSSHKVKSEEDWKEIEQEINSCSYIISDKQFAHRLSPTYLENTTFIGGESLKNVNHWIEILSLWIEGKGLFVTLQVSKEHLEELRNILKSFASFIEVCKYGSDITAEDKAQSLIQRAFSTLIRNKVCYIPLGYVGGLHSGGHSIPLKLVDAGDNIEAFFLNIGEGLHLHPEVGVDDSGRRFHFQSFGSLISKETFSSKKCENVFARLIILQYQTYQQDVNSYRAEDVYLPIYLLGEVQTAFPADIALRSHKPQIGNVCWDMVSLLIGKDFLLDKGYSRKNIHLLITLEKFTDILLFYNKLNGSNSSLDQWTLLKNGIREFSIRISKSKEDLAEKEIEILHNYLKAIDEVANNHIEILKKKSLVELQLTIQEETGLSFEVPIRSLPITPKHIILKAPSFKKLNDLIIIDSMPYLTPQNVCDVLNGCANTVESLSMAEQPHRAHEYAYKVMCSLEIPHPEQNGFWDGVSQEEIPRIIQSLSKLAQHGVQVKTTLVHKCVYRNTLLMTIGYAITDKLVRRIYGQYLKDFAAPFYSSQIQLIYYSSSIASTFIDDADYTCIKPKEEFFDFHLLPLAPANIRWRQIHAYFEGRLALSKHTLFAFDEEVPDLEDALRNYRDSSKIYDAWSPTKDYIKFLEQFLHKLTPEQENLSTYEKFLLLWVNEDDQYIPAEISILHFFAFYSRICSLYFPTRRPRPRVEYTTNRNSANTKYIPPDMQETLQIPQSQNWRKAREVSENQIYCNEVLLEEKDWSRIFSIPSLQITSLVFWMRNHISFLSQKAVQNKVQLALFMPGLLPDAIASEPAILDQLREVIQTGLSAHNKTTFGMETCLFLVRLGVAVETYASKPSNAMGFYEALILEYLQNPKVELSSVYYHLLFLYQFALPRDELSLQECIKARFWLAYHDKKNDSIPPWLLAETLAPFENHHAVAIKAFEKQEWKARLMKDILKLLFKRDDALDIPCTGTYPIVEQGEWKIDLESQAVTLRETHHLVYLKPKQRENLFIFTEDRLFWKVDNELIAVSGRTKMGLTSSGSCVIARQFLQFSGTILEGSWFIKGNLNREYFPESLLNHPGYFDHWMCDKTIVICRKDHYIPLYIAFEQDNGFKVHKLKDNKHPHALLLNLKASIASVQEMIPWFDRLGDREEVCVWINPKTKLVEEIEFLLLELSFQQKEGRFYCKNYPGFYVAREQVIEEVNYFEGGIVLQKESEKMIILPTRELEKADNSIFSKRVKFKSTFHQSERGKIYLYNVDETTGLLINPDANANLHLVFLFALQHEYSKALIYLQRSHSFATLKHEVNWFFKEIYSLQDRSPQAIAFYLRLGLFVLNNTLQIVLNHYESSIGIATEFCNWLGDKLDVYLRIQSLNEPSRIPAAMRLTSQEEIYLLKLMKQILGEYAQKAINRYKEAHEKLEFLPDSIVDQMINLPVQKTNWRGSFETRLELLENRQSNFWITPAFYHLGTRNIFHMIFSELDKAFVIEKPNFINIRQPPEHFLRLRESEISHYFMALYERVQNPDTGWLDLFYVTRSNSLESKVFNAYCTLLTYVNKYPDEFKGLKFTNNANENAQTFEKILSIGGKIYSKLWKSADLLKNVALKEIVLFTYTKKDSLKVVEPQAQVRYRRGLSDETRAELKVLYKEVFNYFCPAWFIGNPIPLLSPSIPFAFSPQLKESLGDTGKNLFNSIHEAYQKLIDPRFGKLAYTLQEGKTAEGCLNEAKDQLRRKRQSCLALKNQAETLANSYPTESYRIGIRKIGSDLPRITVEGILTLAYQKKQMNLIAEANPALNPNQLYTLVELTIRYHILRVQIAQLEKGIKVFEETSSIQEFAEALECHGDFDFTDEPAILINMSRTGKTMLKELADLFTWEIENTKPQQHPRIRGFSIAAGKGKSSFYTPIAMQRYSQLGYTPFSISPKSLIAVDRESLKRSCNDVFSNELSAFELTLSTTTVVCDFQRMYEQVVEHANNRSFKMTPEDFYALHLRRQLALENGDEESLVYLSRICNFLKTKGAALIDESRMTLSPLTKAKIGIGKTVSVPEFDRAIFLAIYRAFVNPEIVLPSRKRVLDTISIVKNQQAMMTSKEMEEVKTAVMQYLFEKSFLKDLDKPLKGRAFDLVEIYFTHIYESSMNLSRGMNYVLSIKSGEQIFTPAHAKQASGAYYSEAYMTLAMTIQGWLQQGLERVDFEILMRTLERHNLQEVKDSNETISALEKKVGGWIGKESISLCRNSVDNIFYDTPFYEAIRYSTEAIFWYLEYVVLKQISSCSEQLTVSPLNLINGFNKIVFYSADIGDEEIYGIKKSPQTLFTTSPFLSQAVHTMMDPKNQQVLTYPYITSPLAFFESLIERDPQIFTHLRMICDAGGELSHYTTEDIVEDFFKFLQKHPEIKIDGINIFEEATRQLSETKLLLYLKDRKDPLELKGQEVPAAYKQLGLDWNQLNILTFVDPSHRAGANIQQHKNTSVLVLIGADLSLSNKIQATERGRGLVKGYQRLILGISEKLAHIIATPISTKPTLDWELRNEEKCTDQEYHLYVIDAIDYNLAEKAWNEIDAQEDVGYQISNWRKYRGGLVIPVEMDIVRRLSQENTAKDLESSLWSYAAERYEAFGYSIAWKNATALRERLKPLINSAVKRKYNDKNFNRMNVLSKTHMHTHQVAEVKTLVKTTHHSNLTSEPFHPLPSDLKIHRNDFPVKMMKYCQSASEAFKSKFLTPQLWFTENALLTAKSGKKSLRQDYLKPLMYFLVIKKQDVWHAFVLTDKESDSFKKQLSENSVLPHQVALLSRDGMIVKNGKGEAAFTKADMTSQFIQDVVIDLGILHCQLYHPGRFVDRIIQWHDFWPMWIKIKEAQADAPNKSSVESIESLIPKHMRESPLTTQDQSSSSTQKNNRIGSWFNQYF